MLRQAQNSSKGKTIFQAKVDVEGRKNQPPQLSEDLISGLIRDVHAAQYDPKVEEERIRKEKQAQLAEERRRKQMQQQ